MKLLETTLSGGSDYASNDAAGAPITVTVKPNEPHVISSGQLTPKECKSRLLSQVKKIQVNIILDYRSPHGM
jgi:hypothetical protein